MDHSDGLHGVWNGTGGLVYNGSMLPATAMSANLSHARAHVWSVSGFPMNPPDEAR